jgi:hypothetical protein
MRWLYFLSRLAFICNLFFLLAFSLQLTQWLKDENLTATIAVMGYFLAIILNPIVNLCYLVLFVLRKPFWKKVPAWLVTANVMFLLFQIFYILYLNDPQHR